MRTGLPDGAVITLNHDGISRAFRIERTIGEGASCIAYEATLVDGSDAGLRCRVKECYPYHAAITRRGSTLVWESEDERECAFQKLRTTHELLLSLRNDDEIGDSIVSSSLYEGNGTLYMVMELNHAVTYDKDGDVSLHETLDTIRVLATHVGQLHRMGYLHLDIKPGNFLVRHHPSTAVWLFDVDSFTSIQEIASGHAVSYPYSRGCAAPEQLCGKTRKLCPATDIFAIGAVLFMKIMGRPVCNEDMGLFADWAFDGEPFDSVNPKVKRILKEIFHKTLAASPSRRFQTVDELLRTIKAALDVTIEGKPYLRSSGISNTIRFVGRENEISRIHEAFAEGKHAVFLHGEGGMGKSCTAIAYSEAYRDEYDAVIFLRYQDSLPETLNRIEICNFDGGNDKEREQTLRRLLDNHVLLIIDNFDVEIDQDEYLPELIDYPAHILITSRTDFASAYEGSVAQIDVGRLTDEQALDIFAHASRLDAEALAHSEGYAKLCRRIEYNTLLLELMGRQCAASCISADELWQRMRPGLKQSEQMEKVWTQKDGRRTRQSIHKALCVLFDTTKLNEIRQRALRNLYVLRFLDIDRDTYCRFTRSKTIDILNELVELGWVQKRGQSFLLHPLIEELVQFELSPSWENCDAFRSIRWLIYETSNLSTDNAEDEHVFEFNSNFLYSFTMHADLGNSEMREMVLYWLSDLMTSDKANMPEPMDQRYNGLYAKLIDLISTCNLTDEEEVRIRSINFAAWLSEYRYIFGGDDREERYEMRDRESRLAYEQLMLVLNGASQELVDEIVADLAGYLNECVDSDITDEYARGLYRLSPCAFDDHEEIRYRLDLPLNDDEKQRWESSRAESRKESPALKTDPVAERIHQCINEYVSANNKKAYIEQIICDESNAPFMRATLLSECMDTIFGGLHMSFTRRDYSKVDWTEQLEILKMEETFLWGMNREELPDEQEQDWNYYVGCNVVNQIIVTAKLEMVDEFEDCAEYLLDTMNRGAQRYLENNQEGWRNLIIMRDYFNLDMNSAVNGLVNIGRACYAVPIVKRYIDGWLSYARRQKNFDNDDERRFVGIYKLLIECMEAASTEENIPEQYQMPYDEMIAEYKRRIEELTDTGYRIRNPEEE